MSRTDLIAPRYASNDIYVLSALANHLERLAQQAYLAIANAQAAEQRAEAQDEASLAELHGTIVLSVLPLKGAEAVLVTGAAPPSAPVRITLLATLSSDIPNVVVSPRARLTKRGLRREVPSNHSHRARFYS